MIKLIKAKFIARRTTIARLRKEIPMINQLIERAVDDGKFSVPININDYSRCTEALLEKAGYRIEYSYISWSHWGVEIDKNEKELMKLADEAGVKVISVQ